MFTPAANALAHRLARHHPRPAARPRLSARRRPPGRAGGAGRGRPAAPRDDGRHDRRRLGPDPRRPGHHADRARPRFTPEQDLLTAYDDDLAVITRRDDAGRATSSVSAAWLQADMLESLHLRPGMTVFETGSGGYNAELIAHLTGPGAGESSLSTSTPTSSAAPAASPQKPAADVSPHCSAMAPSATCPRRGGLRVRAGPGHTEPAVNCTDYKAYWLHR